MRPAEPRRRDVLRRGLLEDLRPRLDLRLILRILSLRSGPCSVG